MIDTVEIPEDTIPRRRVLKKEDSEKTPRPSFAIDQKLLDAFDAFWATHDLASSRSDAVVKAIRFWMANTVADR